MIIANDYLLYPIYLFIFWLLVKKLSKKYEGTNLKNYFILMFFIHIVGSFLHAMVIQYYYGYGDAFIYFEGGGFIKSHFFDSGLPFSVMFKDGLFLQSLPKADDLPPYVFGSFTSDSSLFAMKFMALFSSFSFSHFLVNSIFFGFISFVGTWKLFCLFNDYSFKAFEKKLALLMIYTPTIWFWGSGSGKDSISLALLGILLYSLYSLLIKKQRKFYNIILIIISTILISKIKIALLGIIAVSLLCYFFVSLVRNSSNSFIRFFYRAIAILGVVVLINNSAELIDNSLNDSTLLIESYVKTYSNPESEESQGGFTPPEFEISPIGIFKAIPKIVSSTLFRPYIWEVRNPLMMISALESLLMLLSILYLFIRLKIYYFFKIIFSSPPILFCFIFCMLMAMTVGFTTFNFGTLVRYRLPLLPFYIFMILNTNEIRKKLLL